MAEPSSPGQITFHNAGNINVSIGLHSPWLALDVSEAYANRTWVILFHLGQPRSKVKVMVHNTSGPLSEDSMCMGSSVSTSASASASGSGVTVLAYWPASKVNGQTVESGQCQSCRHQISQSARSMI